MLTRPRTRTIVVLSILASATRAQTTERVSVSSNGAQGSAFCHVSSTSADGRWVAFESTSSDLVPGDTNGLHDVFVRDRLGGTTVRVNVSASGTQANGVTVAPAISADGRWVAFESFASNLVPGDANGAWDVFVKDLASGSVARASVGSSGGEANGNSSDAAISADGRFVAFVSQAALVPGDTNGFRDVHVRDFAAGTTTRVSVGPGGTQADNESHDPSISAGGRYVAFWSFAGNLVAGASNAIADVFVHDRQAGTTTLVSTAPFGLSANGASIRPAISADGRFVAFESIATNLVPGDTTFWDDVFVRDLALGTTTRASVGLGGAEPSAACLLPWISADGRFVAFTSLAGNLVPGDTNGKYDVFLRDRLLGATTRVSVSAAGAQGAADSGGDPTSVGSHRLSGSADARFVTFRSSTAFVPEDTNGAPDVYVRDRGAASAFAALCAGDGSTGACPCTNQGAVGHGCDNSFATGGALLSASGSAALTADTVQLVASGEPPTALGIFLQGTEAVPATSFGDGLRCAGGMLKRLYVANAVLGSTSAPQPGEPSISARSAQLGDPIPAGATRVCQLYYRDPDAGFCPAGGTFNVSNAVAVAWGN